MPPGTKLGNHCLLGCLTIAPVSDKAQQDNTAWLGSPPFFLPRRETQFHITEDKTFYPPKYLYVIRTLFELVRIIVPMTFILTMILGFYVSFDYLTHNYSITELFLLFPFFDIAVLYGLPFISQVVPDMVSTSLYSISLSISGLSRSPSLILGLSTSSSP